MFQKTRKLAEFSRNRVLGLGTLLGIEVGNETFEAEAIFERIYENKDG